MKIADCKDCGKTASVSRKGLCNLCGIERYEKARTQIKLKEGPIYDTWLARSKKHQADVKARTSR